MSRIVIILAPLAILTFCACFLPSCASNRSASWQSQLGVISTSPISPKKMRREVRITQDFIPKGWFGRRLNRKMTPRYITIHSTQNYTGDAFDHARALKNGALKGGVGGYLYWHFTVQDNATIQHIPTNEQGEHADFDGPGNTTSIGIEMCEHRGNNQAKTIDRTAKLAAVLMLEHNIPIDNVVPHYHWPRRGYNPANKNCPHFLLDNGKPKATWRWFRNRVEAHYNRISEWEDQRRDQYDRVPQYIPNARPLPPHSYPVPISQPLPPYPGTYPSPYSP